MTERDDDEKKVPVGKVDPDRAAILARRQRFIALALSGLSTAACTPGSEKSTNPKGDTKGEVAPPNACLKVAAPREDEGDDSAAPHPCLSMPLQPDPQPQVCLKMAAPPPAETGDETGDESETGPAPQPCLSKPVPRPCLKEAAPKPCLKKAAP
jgi:hypothetical protein